MRKLSPKRVFKFALLTSLGYTALYLLVALPGILEGGESRVIALIIVSAVFVLSFGLGLLFGYVFF